MAAKLPFTEDDLKAAAGPTSYARGLGYVDQVEYLAGRVQRRVTDCDRFAGTAADSGCSGHDREEISVL